MNGAKKNLLMLVIAIEFATNASAQDVNDSAEQAAINEVQSIGQHDANGWSNGNVNRLGDARLDSRLGIGDVAPAWSCCVSEWLTPTIRDTQFEGEVRIFDLVSSPELSFRRTPIGLFAIADESVSPDDAPAPLSRGSREAIQLELGRNDGNPDPARVPQQPGYLDCIDNGDRIEGKWGPTIDCGCVNIDSRGIGGCNAVRIGSYRL